VATSPAGASKSGTTVTLTTTVANGFDDWKAGDSITVAGVLTAGYNGNFTIASVVSGTQITFTGNNTVLPASGGGTVSNTSMIPTGTYCARRTDGTTASSISVPNGHGIKHGKITIVAPAIVIQTQNTAYSSSPTAPQHLLFFATGGSKQAAPGGAEEVITVSNSGNSFDGVMYAPSGVFRLSNGGTSGGGHGTIIAWAVNLSGGNGLMFTGDYAPTGGTTTTEVTETVTPGTTNTTTTVNTTGTGSNLDE
jgi:hypothetical protein